MTLLSSPLLFLLIVAAVQFNTACGRLGDDKSDLGDLTEEDNLTVHDQFIVRFDANLSDEELEQHANEAALLMGGEVRFVYRNVFKGAAIVKVPQANINNIASLLETSDRSFTVEQVSLRHMRIMMHSSDDNIICSQTRHFTFRTAK